MPSFTLRLQEHRRAWPLSWTSFRASFGGSCRRDPICNKRIGSSLFGGSESISRLTAPRADARGKMIRPKSRRNDGLSGRIHILQARCHAAGLRAEGTDGHGGRRVDAERSPVPVGACSERERRASGGVVATSGSHRTQTLVGRDRRERSGPGRRPMGSVSDPRSESGDGSAAKP